MRPNDELSAIVDAIRAATPEQPIDPLEMQKEFLYAPPLWRRAFKMALQGRQQKMDEMSRVLSASTLTPEWVAMMAIEAVVPIDHERELDDPANHPSILERATLAMGLNFRAISWTTATPN